MRKAKEGLRGEFALCIHFLGVGPRLPIRKARTHKTRQNRMEGKEVVKTKQVGSREQKCHLFCIFSKWSAYETAAPDSPPARPHAPFPPGSLSLPPPPLQCAKASKYAYCTRTGVQDDLQDGKKGELSCRNALIPSDLIEQLLNVPVFVWIQGRLHCGVYNRLQLWQARRWHGPSVL